MTRLVRSEFRKIVTTNTWWLFLLGVLGFTAISFAINALQAHSYLHAPQPALPPGISPDQARQIRAAYAARVNLPVEAASLYTSGQYFALLFILLLGILVVTNEFFHQTATSTFLVTPQRTRVIVGKLLAAVVSAAGLWVGLTVLCVLAGAIFFAIDGEGAALTDPAVVRAVLLNLLAYAIWSVFGIGLGTLIRSQIAAVVVALVLYLVASQIAAAVIQLVALLAHADWVMNLAVLVPSVASQAMIAGGAIPGNPPQWLGALVLIGYGAVAGTIGTLLTRRRDVG